MEDVRTPEERALVRAAAEDIVSREASWQYRQMARGTLAALDWVEGRSDVSPSSGELHRPEDIVERGPSYRPSALVLEILRTQDWGSGHVRPPNEDRYFHDGVWALLHWWQRPSDQSRHLAISVPGLAV